MRNPGFGKKTIFAASFLVCFFVAAYSFAETLSSAELIENSKKYDGKTVTYIGEVIGDIMRRGNFSWVNISDGENAIGVWMSADMAKTIKFTGNYKSKGDKLKVTGIFNRACIQHGGDLDIHAQAVSKTEEGARVERPLRDDKKKLGIILLGAVFFIWILTLFKRK